MRKLAFLSTLALASFGTGVAAQSHFDFGAFRDHELNAHAQQLFGVNGPLQEASTASIDATTADADPTALVTTARGLRARVVSASGDLGAKIDMMALWPDDKNPTHLIVCNEVGSGPSLQRVRLADGSVETILTGMEDCDPAHVTPWGTVVVAEESGNDGSMLEIMDPLNTDDVSYNHLTHVLSGGDAGNVAYRGAVGHLSFEGVGILPNGVIYYGDENRPDEGTGGGAYFKFIPETPWTGGSPITHLIDSPLAMGRVYGLRLGMRDGDTDYGQGSEIGKGVWVDLGTTDDADLRALAASNDLTGYYRPEDLSIDQKALEEDDVRFCGNNTGNEEADSNWGNTICLTDGTLDEAADTETLSTPNVQLFVTGTPDFAMMDNIAYQPGRGNWAIQEDRDAVEIEDREDEGYPFNNSIWMCLEDGDDVDYLSDGCVRIVTLNDLTAESTGGLFDASGKKYYFSVQHNVTGHGVILELTGWK